MGEFEDNWEDEIESEEDVIDGEEQEGMEVDEEEEEEKEPEVQVYLPGQTMEKDEVLEVDNSAYHMLHTMTVKWPCLSFDILHDNLGENRNTYPATSYLVTGTQADRAKNNELIVMKMSQLCKTIHDNDDSDAEDSDDDVDDDPILETKSVKHVGGVNRVRAMPQPGNQIVATWAETGKVHIWDVAPLVNALDSPGATIPQHAMQPIYTVGSHSVEGFAMDWSETVTGRLLTGDFNKNIYLTNPAESTFLPDMVPFHGHTSSIEDIQWSPNQKSVFASCSADQTVRIWDVKNKKKDVFSIKAHDADVNVISWNRKVNYLLASGSDDGVFSIWDMRTFSNQTTPTPVATFKWHSAPITSIEWHPHEESVLGVAGADDQVTIWDLSVEQDAEEEGGVIMQENGMQVPPQLLFIHQGQNDIKEIHWHKQIPGCMVSTAGSGFNIFKTISV
ncbi:WD40 repeat-like protein [Basidiobolus meristosporus CBS 931.73]|uniref:Glutamate-rich WD repeat-containing protein 1 n=1 Tax=Basidiobolus meristosporus CBS 931.73 TaxID=1314790 RepID=A0A1Y1XZZ8_9FUNG|nr:WD40 repeat-like protein [Basidiobolus meristosporus CBS 931.73]|eukprot:ORX91298.1 WD40 repeat-like protein [Basidiobolus meristosporus CBS 931.73]